MSKAHGLVARIRDNGLALSLGILIGVVGHAAWQRVAELDLGPDPMAYVDVVDDLHPVGASPEAMIQRLDRLTARSWELDNFFVGVERGPQSLPANQAALSETMGVPASDRFRLRGIVTNIRVPDSVADSGAFAIIRFSGLDQARAWLRQDPQVFVDEALDERRDTYWAGDMAIYYSPPETGTDYSSVIRQWAQEVSDCPETAGECAASSTG